MPSLRTASSRPRTTAAVSRLAASNRFSSAASLLQAPPATPGPARSRERCRRRGRPTETARRRPRPPRKRKRNPSGIRRVWRPSGIGSSSRQASLTPCTPRRCRAPPPVAPATRARHSRVLRRLLGFHLQTLSSAARASASAPPRDAPGARLLCAPPRAARLDLRNLRARQSRVVDSSTTVPSRRSDRPEPRRRAAFAGARARLPEPRRAFRRPRGTSSSCEARKRAERVGLVGGDRRRRRRRVFVRASSFAPARFGVARRAERRNVGVAR